MNRGFTGGEVDLAECGHDGCWAESGGKADGEVAAVVTITGGREFL